MIPFAKIIHFFQKHTIFPFFLYISFGGFIFNSYFKFRMLRRYRKIKVDMPLFSGEDRGRYSVCNRYAAKLLSYISFYLHLLPSISKASEACES